MQRSLSEIEARGAQVVAVAQGTPAEAARYCRALGVTYDCLGDPDKAGYRAYALPRAGWREILVEPLLARGGLARVFQASLRGSLAPHSDWFQLPGVALVDREGRLRWYHRARNSVDIPSAETVLAQLEALAS